tara:strand:- start:147 stop:569 length:423 start_codon:yes stop_codon:yes gene_type:complete
MSTENKQKYKCPECESDTIRFKFKVYNNDKNSAYSDVTEEIQCATCFMDIPADIFIINKNSNFEENKNIWNSFYKPEHIKRAAQCSKCNLYYWQIEKKLSVQNNLSSDIFYQTFDTKGGGGKMICRLCDPKAFTNQKNKE